VIGNFIFWSTAYPDSHFCHETILTEVHFDSDLHLTACKSITTMSAYPSRSCMSDIPHSHDIEPWLGGQAHGQGTPVYSCGCYLCMKVEPVLALTDIWTRPETWMGTVAISRSYAHDSNCYFFQDVEVQVNIWVRLYRRWTCRFITFHITCYWPYNLDATLLWTKADQFPMC